MEKILKNSEIEESIKILNEMDSILNTSDPNRKLPIKFLWKIDTNYRIIQEIAYRIEEKRNEIITKYRSDDYSIETILENGESVRQIKPEYYNEYIEQMNDISNIENKIVIDEIHLSEIENYNIIPSDFKAIKFMIEENI